MKLKLTATTIQSGKSVPPLTSGRQRRICHRWHVWRHTPWASPWYQPGWVGGRCGGANGRWLPGSSGCNLHCQVRCPRPDPFWWAANSSGNPYCGLCRSFCGQLWWERRERWGLDAKWTIIFSEEPSTCCGDDGELIQFNELEKD